MGSIYQYIHVAFQGSFACITVGLIVGALAERIRFSAVLIFVVVWLTLSYIPIAHMVWGGGLLASHGALDFAGGTVVHINAAIAGLVGAYLIGKRVGFGKEAFKPHNLPMVFTGTAILYIGWFGFNAGSAGTANEIAALAFVNTVVATAAAILGWIFGEWALREAFTAGSVFWRDCRSGRRDASLWLHWCWRRVDYRRGSGSSGLVGRYHAQTLAAGG